MTNFLDDIVEANAIESQLTQQYKADVAARQAVFRVNAISIVKLLPQIRGAVEAKFGKNSQEYAAASSIINQMTSAKLVKAPSAGTDGNAGENGGAQTADAQQGISSISKSQQSYGSLLGYFNQLINALSKMNGYDPSNAALKVANLQTFAQSVDVLNTNVAQKYLELHQQRQERLGLYDTLSSRIQKVKAYVKSEYGMGSEEYGLVKGVDV